MKSLLSSLLALGLSVLFVSCDKESNESKLIVGKWDLVKEEYKSVRSEYDEEQHKYVEIVEDVSIDHTSSAYKDYERWIFDDRVLTYPVKVNKETWKEDDNSASSYIYEIHNEGLYYLTMMKQADIIKLTNKEMIMNHEKRGRLYFVKR